MRVMHWDTSITPDFIITKKGRATIGERSTTVSSKGQITIPVELRKAMGIKSRDRVAFELVDGEVHLRPVGSRLLAGYGAIKPKARPEDFRSMRREVEEEWGEEAGKTS